MQSFHTRVNGASEHELSSHATLPYYRLADTAHRHTVGVRPLGDAPVIEVDDAAYGEELALKRALLQRDHSYCYAAQPHTTLATWEVLALILQDLAVQSPADFSLHRSGAEWTWTNHLLGETTTFRYGDSTTLPWEPLDWVGRQVQEDLLLLAPGVGVLPEGPDAEAHSPDYRLVAGQLCFPNRWSLGEKLGLTFLAVHEPVPGFVEQIGHASNLLLARLKPSRPVWRYNWSLTVGGELDLSTRVYADVLARMSAVTPANCGETCFLRAERQVLARLPQSGAVLFTIHTYRTPLAALVHDAAWAQRFLKFLTPPHRCSWPTRVSHRWKPRCVPM
jgi:hypothetical protein